MTGRLVLLLVVLVGISSAYDTGHHNDLTRNALQLAGYNSNAQIIAGIANFFVDYFAFTPLSSENLPELNMMHFDNIFTMKNASDYWTQFTLNAKNAVEIAARNNDPLEFIMTIGGTLHTVQDFYTHSNWVDFHYRTECDCYRTETWLHKLHEVNGNPNELLRQHAAVHTYSYGECNEESRNCYAGQLPHGDACGGINKDSYVRPYWEQSYAFAFSASVEWLDNIQKWASAINPGIISQAQNYAPPTDGDLNDMNSLNDYVHTVSYAIKFMEEDGHWKGPGSGSLKRFLPAQLAFTKSTSIFKAKYQSDKIHQRWTFPNIYDGAGIDRAQTVDVSTITSITTPYQQVEAFTPVVVRTVSVQGQDKTNTPSYFATVTIDGMEFVDAVYVDQYSFTPHWTSIKFVNTSANPTVPIVYTLKNNHYPKGDEVVPITNNADRLSLTFNLASHALTGDVTGTYDSISNTFSTKNDNENVAVQLFVTANRFANCSQGLPQQYCPNEAYVYAGAFGECEGETIPEESVASLIHVSALALIGLLASLL